MESADFCFGTDLGEEKGVIMGLMKLPGYLNALDSIIITL